MSELPEPQNSLLIFQVLVWCVGIQGIDLNLRLMNRSTKGKCLFLGKRNAKTKAAAHRSRLEFVPRKVGLDFLV